MANVMKNYLKYNLIFTAREIKHFFIDSHNIAQLDQNHTKKIYVMATPTHGNLGDQAIAFAQNKFIQENFRDYSYIEVPYDDVIRNVNYIKKNMNKDDIIFIPGGGNMGDMYYWEERVRRYIIRSFKHNLIISFPQTISFSATYTGKHELKKTIRIYKNNHHLLIVARETKSYESMKKIFGAEKVRLTPDIVLSLNERKESVRAGILLCFRSDEEQFVKKDLKANLMKMLQSKGETIKKTDTVVNRRVTAKVRPTELNRIWNQFRSSEVVLTDRLHGMIFCAITGTPCIVFKNANHKIEYSYKNWLETVPFIRFVDVHQLTDIKDLERIIDDLRHLDREQRICPDFTKQFSPLIESINKAKVE
ncbi:polysaccharide pyruvyl transferase family protein [Sporolactobacillus shoreicorticis]|uniref:Polysaccharide pyruvyl transferase family protein n=1 Tax=Sporolactobacillus shoreicorticis TaxID=1923877 RepID=A0ABW5S3A0_9BACL|nr:polysaccharide pyruvyl transferase family protein [Sporolactobacillus shoreicorticis]MCO7124214.1 polysaccharide pyruvyl transferase family protein [Sporolactobacillus shoreicorticis]